MALLNQKALSILGMTLAAALVMSAAIAVPQKKKPQTKKPTKPNPAAMIAAGKKVYDANACGGCHKIGDKGGDSGPELTLVGTDKKKDAKWMAVHIKDPKKHVPDSTMPGYADKIKGKDLDNIVAYMLSLKGAKKEEMKKEETKKENSDG